MDTYNLDDIPPEIMIEIIKHLDNFAIKNLQLSCAYFNIMFHNEPIVKKLFKQETKKYIKSFKILDNNKWKILLIIDLLSKKKSMYYIKVYIKKLKLNTYDLSSVLLYLVKLYNATCDRCKTEQRIYLTDNIKLFADKVTSLAPENNVKATILGIIEDELESYKKYYPKNIPKYDYNELLSPYDSKHMELKNIYDITCNLIARYY